MLEAVKTFNGRIALEDSNKTKKTLIKTIEIEMVRPASWASKDAVAASR